MTYRPILLTLFLAACGGAPAAEPQAPEPAAPEPATAPVAAEPEAEPEPEQEPMKLSHVSVPKVEINGGGAEEEAIRKALAEQAKAFEACYAETLKTVADLEGRVLVSYLFVKGERKSVSASHAGMGAKTINPCFHNAAAEAKFEVDAKAERTSITVTFKMTKNP